MTTTINTSRTEGPPSNCGRGATRLSMDQCRQLHEYSVTVLEKTGVRIYCQEALELLARNGARATDGNLVRIPAGLVDRALETAPKQFRLFGQPGSDRADQVLEVGGYRSYYGTGSDCLHIIDHRTNRRRDPVLQDVVEGAIVCEALPNVDFVMSMFLPRDVPAVIADRLQMEVMLTNTSKPIIFVTNEFSGCVDVVEMAEAVAGGPSALEEKPFIGCYINVTTGLRQNEEAVQKLLYLASRNIPALYIPSGIGGLNAPVTPAGCMTLKNAGMLVGLVLAQLKRPGAPVGVPGWGCGGFDMRTMVAPYCTPNAIGLAHSMGHFYGLPIFGMGGATDAKVVDQQASAEAALSLFAEAVGGANLVHDLGYLESGKTGSLGLLAICDEVINWIKAFQAPLEVNEVSVPLDVIAAVGPDGGFLDQDHTVAHHRKNWYPKMIERANYESWEAAGGLSMLERASQRVDKILAAHRPTPRTPEVTAAVRAIVCRATAQLV